MTLQNTKAMPTVAISASESPDMAALGLSDEHLQDAMAEIALHLLSSGTSLAYGGDLRPHGFTELLFELVARYRGHPHHNGKITVTDYLAWPVHIRMTADDLVAFAAGHEESTHLVFLAQDGTQLGWERLELPVHVHEPDDDEWAEGLTMMRIVMQKETQARIVLGGKVDGYKGRMPGIAEEALLSLQSHQPIFLLGGFGGCTRDIAETIGLADPWAGSRSHWDGRPSLFIDTSVDTGGISDSLSDESIREKIRDEYLRDSTVTIVLVGTETKRRKHIDWEIYSSMYDGAVNKKSGVLVLNDDT